MRDVKNWNSLGKPFADTLPSTQGNMRDEAAVSVKWNWNADTKPSVQGNMRDPLRLADQVGTMPPIQNLAR